MEENFPDIKTDKDEAVWDILKKIHAADNSIQFIFVLDEWDYIFHRKFVTEADKESYIEFLSSLLKDKPYVALAYMTGILPIAKYSNTLFRYLNKHPYIIPLSELLTGMIYLSISSSANSST